MDWFQFIIILVAIYAAYCLGHWTGYGKGEQDTRELTNEIKRLNSIGMIEMKSPTIHSLD